MLTDAELAALEARCRSVPLTTSSYIETDFVATLLNTVMDYQNHTRTVEKAIQHFNNVRRDEVRAIDDLEGVLARFPDDRDGNRLLAEHLWGNNHWRRAGELRGLVGYFRDLNVTTLDALREWARRTTSPDFVGRVKGLGAVIYQWLVMRLGVETVKPDTHVARFAERACGRRVTEPDTIAALEEVAHRIGIKANLLDWSIWEHERKGG